MVNRAELIDFVNEQISQNDFRESLADWIVKLCRINSTPDPNVEEMRHREHEVFEMIRTIASQGWPTVEWELRPIDFEQIRSEPSYTPPYYTSHAAPYAGRANLVLRARCPVPAVKESAVVAVNAHIDTVHPHVAPEIRDGRVFARGACDDKGNVVVMLGALHLLNRISKRFGMEPQRDFLYMFVIDEESGGNGSLALAVDQALKREYDELIVAECCDNTVYCANRGAVWFRIELPASISDSPISTAANIVLSLEAMGRQLRAESDHPLFLSRPVQTCHGVWGPWGEHPSRVCGYVELSVQTTLQPADLDSVITGAVRSYTSHYGDKTEVSRDGHPVVPWHYRLEKQEGGFTIKVMGSTGHMAAVAENDGALTKAACIIQALEAADDACQIELLGHEPDTPLVLEGGQSFVPTHSLKEVNERIWSACADVLGPLGVSDAGIRNIVTMNKLHNSAFCSDPESALFNAAREYAGAVGMVQVATPQGWGASCDARLFAEQYPDIPIITFGAGDLNNAHSDTESVGIDDVARNAAMLALVVLQRSGAPGLLHSTGLSG